MLSENLFMKAVKARCLREGVSNEGDEGVMSLEVSLLSNFCLGSYHLALSLMPSVAR